MNYDNLKQLWHSPENHPTTADNERLRLTLAQTLRRNHRGFVVRISLALILTLVPVAGFVRHVMRGGAFAWEREWAMLLLLSLPIAGAFIFIRRQWQHLRAHAGSEGAVGTSLRALLDANQAAQQRAVVIQFLLLTCVPVLAIGIWQLQSVGKLHGQQTASMSTAMAVVIFLSLAGLAWERRRLKPQAEHLRGLLAEWENVV